MDGEEWSVEDGLLAEELMLAAERQASSRGTSTSAPARVDASKFANGRSVVTRSRVRAAQYTGTTPAAQPEDLPAAAADDASPRRSAAALESTDDADLSLISPSRKLVEVDVTEIVVDAREQHNVIPEVEDIGTVMDRRQLRPSGFSVTDFTASEWCQQQYALALTARLPDSVTKTEAMAEGKTLHAALEAEVKVAVKVEVLTQEDAWAVRLLDTIACLRQLLKTGLTREVYVFGNMQGQWVKGIVDQLELDDCGRVRIVEHKTRRAESLPQQAQQQTARLQARCCCYMLDLRTVMLYRALLSGLANACDGDNARELLQLHGLDGRAELSKGVKRHARASGISLVLNLEHVLDCLYAQAGRLPACSPRMQVQYLWQRDGRLLGSVDVDWDAQALQNRLQAHLAVLHGQRPPAKVPLADEWKCERCLFFHSCRGPRATLPPAPAVLAA